VLGSWSPDGPRPVRRQPRHADAKRQQQAVRHGVLRGGAGAVGDPAPLPAKVGKARRGTLREADAGATVRARRRPSGAASAGRPARVRLRVLLEAGRRCTGTRYRGRPASPREWTCCAGGWPHAGIRRRQRPLTVWWTCTSRLASSAGLEDGQAADTRSLASCAGRQQVGAGRHEGNRDRRLHLRPVPMYAGRGTRSST
jgi:hypothetical protein